MKKLYGDTSTETDVVGHCGIFRIRSQHRSRTCGGIVYWCLHHQFLIVLDPVITGIEVDDVSQQCEDEDPHTIHMVFTNVLHKFFFFISLF